MRNFRSVKSNASSAIPTQSTQAFGRASNRN